MKSISLIVPIAADKPEYSDSLPYVFGLGEDGIIVCIKSILGMNLKKFSKIYFTILRKHDELYFISDSLKLQFKRLGLTNAEVIVLNKPTLNQADTVFQTIRAAKISGPIFIKDGDSFFSADIVDPIDAVAIYPIEELDILDPKDKSYVAVDDMFYITNIIEKKVVGHYINAGGYLFSDAENFCFYYSRLSAYGHLYLSNIIYAMLLDKRLFRPIQVKSFFDWGNKNIYNYNIKKK